MTISCNDDIIHHLCDDQKVTKTYGWDLCEILIAPKIHIKWPNCEQRMKLTAWLWAIGEVCIRPTLK